MVLLSALAYCEGGKDFARAARENKVIMALASLSQNLETKDFFLDILPTATRRAFLASVKLKLFKDFPWYLAGGTALALQVGHRQSVDLDFFTQRNKFKENFLERTLMKTHQWETTYRETGTLYGKFMKAKMSFIAYPFFIPSRETLHCGTVSLLKPKDIATMKIIAISQRGRKRDFVDLFWYCMNREPLGDVLWRVGNHFPGQERNTNHLIRSLTYFADAESDPMPKIFFKTNWNEIKNFFKKEVPKAAKVILRLE